MNNGSTIMKQDTLRFFRVETHTNFNNILNILCQTHYRCYIVEFTFHMHIILFKLQFIFHIYSFKFILIPHKVIYIPQGYLKLIDVATTQGHINLVAKWILLD